MSVKAPYGETPRVYGFLSHLPGLPTVKGILSVEGNVKAPYGVNTEGMCFLSHLSGILTVEGIMSVEANVKSPYGETPRVCEAIVVGVRTSHMSPVFSPLICRRCPHRATLNPFAEASRRR